MENLVKLETDRLLLRQWKVNDFPLFSSLNADPIVMEYFPSTLSEEESNRIARKIQSLIYERGWGFWATEEKVSRNFIGFVGLHTPEPELPFSPCVEVGWRLAKEYWGKGYATEAAKEALKYAFDKLRLEEVYSFTSVDNSRSRAVMERLRMLNMNQNFEHPKVPKGNALREHVLYKITKTEWLNNAV